MTGGKGISCIKRILRCKDGNSTPTTVALVLGLLLLICGVAEFFRLMVIVQGVRDGLQQAVVAVMTTNYDEAYNGLREGYSGGICVPATSGWKDLIIPMSTIGWIRCWEPDGRGVTMLRCRHRKLAGMNTVFRGFPWRLQTHRSHRGMQARTWRRM